jgi:hypothetical protein
MRIALDTLILSAEPKLTAALYADAPPVNPLCCNACATFARVIDDRLLPARLTDFLCELGVVPATPVEAWGAPDGGFLQVWWPVVIHPPLPSEVVNIGGGATVTLTEHYPHPSWEVSPEHLLPAVELTWDSKELIAVERHAWHRAPAHPHVSAKRPLA